MARLRGRERLSGRQRLTPFGNALEAPLKWGFTQSSSGLRRAGGYWTNHGEKTKLSADPSCRGKRASRPEAQTASGSVGPGFCFFSPRRKPITRR